MEQSVARGRIRFIDGQRSDHAPASRQRVRTVIVVVADLNGIEHAQRRTDDGFRPGWLVTVEHSARRMPPGHATQFGIGRKVFAVARCRDRVIQVEQKRRSDRCPRGGFAVDPLNFDIVACDEVAVVDDQWSVELVTRPPSTPGFPSAPQPVGKRRNEMYVVR